MIDGWAGRGGCSTLAHRGGAALGPANSLVAVQRSVAAGAHAIDGADHEDRRSLHLRADCAARDPRVPAVCEMGRHRHPLRLDLSEEGVLRLGDSQAVVSSDGSGRDGERVNDLR